MTSSARLRRGGWPLGCLLVMAVGCASTDADVDARPADSGCAWGRCAKPGPRCVATGIADGAWLTADFNGTQIADCTMVPPELREAGSTGRFSAGEAPVGEITCEGMRPGPATLRLKARVRMLTSQGSSEDACHCLADWSVALRVLVEAQPAASLVAIGDRSADGSCRRGPDFDQELGVVVDPDGRLHARIELTRCVRPGATSCLFLRGTGVEVTQ